MKYHRKTHIRFWKFLYWVSGKIGVLFLNVAVRTFGYANYRHGRASFWGTKEFVASAREAVALLQTKDPEKAERISCIHWIFWYSPKTCMQGANSFSIDSNYLSWEAEGILAYLVLTEQKYAFLGDVLFKPPWSDEEVRRLNEAYDGASKWFRSHNLAPELCEVVSRPIRT